MFTRKRQDMRSSCLANHVTPATPVTETKNCLYISHHTPLFGALVGLHCAVRDLGPSTLETNSLLACASLWWTCSLGRFGDTGSEHNTYLFLLFSGTLHSDAYIFPFRLCFLPLFFSQLFVRPPQTAILLFCISFPWGWS